MRRGNKQKDSGKNGRVIEEFQLKSISRGGGPVKFFTQKRVARHLKQVRKIRVTDLRFWTHQRSR